MSVVPWAQASTNENGAVAGNSAGNIESAKSKLIFSVEVAELNSVRCTKTTAESIGMPAMRTSDESAFDIDKKGSLEMLRSVVSPTRFAASFPSGVSGPMRSPAKTDETLAATVSCTSPCVCTFHPIASTGTLKRSVTALSAMVLGGWPS